jgi:hypothetical protein
MLFEFARANSYRSAYTDEISQIKFANLISVSIKGAKTDKEKLCRGLTLVHTLAL